MIGAFQIRPEVLRLVLTALGAQLVLWQKLLVPVLLGLLVYAWSCLLADRLAHRWGPSRTVAGVAGCIARACCDAAQACRCAGWQLPQEASST